MEIKPTLQQAYDLFHNGVLCFTDMEDEGICIDRDYYEKTYVQLTKRIAHLVKNIGKHEEAHLFEDKMGRPIATFDVEKNKLHISNQDLTKLFFNFMEMKPIKLTEKENYSSDENVLEKIGTPFCKDLLKIKKLEKNRTTYILGIYGVSFFDERDGLWKIHPSFNLHIPRSYRSSSSDPNFQNVPIHDEESKKLVRTGIIPRPGNKLGWADYGGHEIRIFACYCKDPVLILDIVNKVDVHGYWGEYLGVKRYDAKNCFVFPQIYGSYYKSCWSDLVGRGYKELKESRVEQAEREFWKKYRKGKEWQEQLIKDYHARGYLEMLTGFRVVGWLGHNQIINTPIQGTAFHLLLWSCIEVNRIRREEGWKSKLIGQIHDEMVLDIDPKEEGHVRETIEWVMVEGTKRAYPWINVPLVAEYGSCEIDQPWGEAKK